MFPFVVPERVTGAEPPPIMRFVLKSETRFQTLGLPAKIVIFNAQPLHFCGVRILTP